MTDPTPLHGVLTALVTPFSADSVDLESLGALIDRQIDGGVHGLVPCGTTGESPTLSPEEHERVIEFTVERAAGRVPVVAGTGSNSTREALRYTQSAKDAGASAALVVLPYYNRPTPDGIVAHFTALSEVGLPIVLYNIPSRCGIGLTIETYRELAKLPNIVATKEAAGSCALVDSVLEETSLQVLSGDDALTLPFLCVGAHGVISVVSNVEPQGMVALYEAARAGRLDEARVWHRRLLPTIRALFLESNPAPTKALLALRGEMEEIVRSPLVPVSESTRKVLAGLARL